MVRFLARVATVSLRVRAWGLGVFSRPCVQERIVGTVNTRRVGKLLLTSVDLDRHWNRAIVWVTSCVGTSLRLSPILRSLCVLSLIIKWWQVLPMLDHNWWLMIVSMAMASVLLWIHLVTLLVLSLLLWLLLLLLLLLLVHLSLGIGLLLDVYIVFRRCTLLLSLPKNEAWVDWTCSIDILSAIDGTNHAIVRGSRCLSRGCSLTSMSSTVTIVSLPNRSNDHILNIVVDGKINSWFLHHFNFLVGCIIVIANHLLNILLMTLSIGSCCIIIGTMVRVILLLCWVLSLCPTSLLRVSSIFARLHPVGIPLD